ncbi:MAG TPA: 16S rRNA (cytidine(1402)-2'-O)-methyltransferase [Aggregatilineales bacterium]|nr:16S rRNA (cytidine(1402)-2'-O)-methyltransferase [Aggregatilineales bacterium]
MAGTLYIVPTPIGNLEDITLRALRVLRKVSLIAAEDTRTTGRLLAHYGIETPQTSYHEHNKLTKLDRILDALAVGDVALVSDAGTPGLSDPGYELIGAVLEAGMKVVPLPGPSAVISALVASGLPTDSFTYLGFLPRKSQARREALAAVRDVPHTLVLYEAPHRLLDTLADVQAVLGARQVVVTRELTKLHEEIWRGGVQGAIRYYTENPPRGEITLVIGGAATVEPREWTEDEVRAALAERLAAGESRSAAAKAVAQAAGWPKSRVYGLDVG